MRAPIFLSWSPGAPHILGRNPGALNPFGTLKTAINSKFFLRPCVESFQYFFFFWGGGGGGGAGTAVWNLMNLEFFKLGLSADQTVLFSNNLSHLLAYYPLIYPPPEQV